jgi:hypothetical protein
MGSLLDLTGKTFGRLRVTARVTQTQCGSVLWCCKCTCGNKVVVNGASLRYQRTRSCGCWMRELTSKANTNPHATRNKVWRSYNNSADIRSLKFSLSAEQFDVLLSGDCYYCGDPPKYESVSFAGHTFLYNGIDRLDSHQGYVDGNCVSCCRPCNLMKRATPLSEFLARIHVIANKHTRSM